MKKPDYSKYTYDELLEIKSTINRDEYPDRFELLKLELLNRKKPEPLESPRIIKILGIKFNANYSIVISFFTFITAFVLFTIGFTGLFPSINLSILSTILYLLFFFSAFFGIVFIVSKIK